MHISGNGLGLGCAGNSVEDLAENVTQRMPLSASRLQQVLKFRMGCHGLPRDSGSLAGVSRANSICQIAVQVTNYYIVCGAGSMGDKRHVVFECPHLQSIRDKYACLFSVSTMVQYFRQVILCLFPIFSVNVHVCMS